MTRFLMALAAFGAAALVLTVAPGSGTPGSPVGRERAVHERRRQLADDGRRLPGTAGLTGPGGGDLPRGAVQREPLRVVARGQARYRGPRRHVEVLLRQVLDLLHVLPRRVPDSRAGRRRATTRSRATTASRPARRRCRRAGPTRPTPTPTSTPRAASTRRCCRSTRSSTQSRLHPDGEIDISYSDDLGRHWVKGNGGVPLEPPNNASAKQVGHVEDKQWIAVNHIVGNRFQDHVYAAWAVFNGNGGGIKVRMAVSRDRGQTFAKAVTISPPSAGRRGRHLRLPGDRRGGQPLRLGRVVPAERRLADDLRRALDR